MSKNMYPKVVVDSPDVTYSEHFIEAKYNYTSNTVVESDDGHVVVKPKCTKLTIQTDRKVPKLGVMLVGLGGNNGVTFASALLANKHKMTWETKKGSVTSNWLGSITQCSSIRLGNSENEDYYVPLSDVVPLVDPDDILLDGWDISSADLASALKRAKVLDYDLQRQLKPYLEKIKPRPSIYNYSFIASNQEERADNILKGTCKQNFDQIRTDIREMKNTADKVIVLWTASTERYSEIVPGVHDTAKNVLKAIEMNDDRLSPSTLFALASILEDCPFINGSPQNTFIPGVVELAQQQGVFIAGDDFKSGQTKVKSAIVEFLLNAGIKPVAIASYNHLGNNDGKNLSSQAQFKSKEISKSSVIDDMIKANKFIYSPGEKVDHLVDIKYVPYVGDSKRALDEYTSELMLGGTNTLVLHNTCEDSLLATPIILDLVILAEFATRVKFRSESGSVYIPFEPILSMLGYLCKSPLVPKGTPVINALSKQKACIDNILRACIGLPPEHSMGLEFKLPKCLFFTKENGYKQNYIEFM
ncbi:inositol-3-phosphate synthase [Cimex lectularius]|uniref:Inositol-3-phosphate synthase n=1 Tax=Cimex lectularius TaxID=79782 RepID=A0A8I6S634_CIMLE|nr:inositol-3-phosphate synthase [Cimex lectularius]